MIVKNYYFDNFFDYKVKLYNTFHPFIGIDNFAKYKYGDNVRKPKDGIIEIIFSLTILPLFGFFKTTFDLFIIKELGVFHLLFPEVIYQFVKDLIIIIYKIIKGIIDEIQITKFIFIGISNFFALLGFAIYLEIIKLKFCGLDYNTKENIIERSMIESGDPDNDFLLSDDNEDDEISDNENNDENNYN